MTSKLDQNYTADPIMINLRDVRGAHLFSGSASVKHLITTADTGSSQLLEHIQISNHPKIYYYNILTPQY